MSKFVPCRSLDKKQLKTHAGGGECSYRQCSGPALPGPGGTGALGRDDLFGSVLCRQ